MGGWGGELPWGSTTDPCTRLAPQTVGAAPSFPHTKAADPGASCWGGEATGSPPPLQSQLGTSSCPQRTALRATRVTKIVNKKVTAMTLAATIYRALSLCWALYLN